MSRRPTTRPPRLQMTSLVDMMVILVVFLLTAFSVEGELVTAAPGVELPTSTEAHPSQESVSIVVGPTGVIVNGSPTGDLPAALSEIAPETAITIQADRRERFDALKLVLRACADAGLENLSLLVQHEDGGAS